MPQLTQTQKELLMRLDYNPNTGVFRWLIFRPLAKGLKKYPFTIAGNYSRKPLGKTYLNINYKSMTYGCHRLAWMFTYKETPSKEYRVDHIDGDTLNNKIDNLRLLNPSDNAKNIVLISGEGFKFCKVRI